jgi:hypothetical protein
MNSLGVPAMQHISMGFIVACGVISLALLISASVYSFYKFYWSRRHFFEVLE